MMELEDSIYKNDKKEKQTNKQQSETGAGVPDHDIKQNQCFYFLL